MICIFIPQVVIARQFYFNFTTPDRSRTEMLCTSTPLPTEHWPFVRLASLFMFLFISYCCHCVQRLAFCAFYLLMTRFSIFYSKGDGKIKEYVLPSTPNAPRHGPRPPSRLKLTEMRQIAAVLFQESAYPPRYIVPSSLLPKPICKSFASNRVLFYDEELELCQAVAQNKLRQSSFEDPFYHVQWYPQHPKNKKKKKNPYWYLRFVPLVGSQSKMVQF